eukprot:scaffold170821_cov33-Tisochrysis_lutea.AAC.1
MKEAKTAEAIENAGPENNTKVNAEGGLVAPQTTARAVVLKAPSPRISSDPEDALGHSQTLLDADQALGGSTPTGSRCDAYSHDLSMETSQSGQVANFAKDQTFGQSENLHAATLGLTMTASRSPSIEHQDAAPHNGSRFKRPAKPSRGPIGANNVVSSLKIIIVGDSGVGKSALVRRFVEDVFDVATGPTIGLDVSTRSIDLGEMGGSVKLDLWDSAGQERFAPLLRSYYRGAGGVIYAFDVTSRKSFERIDDYWTGQVSLELFQQALEFNFDGDELGELTLQDTCLLGWGFSLSACVHFGAMLSFRTTVLGQPSELVAVSLSFTASPICCRIPEVHYAPA